MADLSDADVGFQQLDDSAVGFDKQLSDDDVGFSTTPLTEQAVTGVEAATKYGETVSTGQPSTEDVDKAQKIYSTPLIPYTPIKAGEAEGGWRAALGGGTAAGAAVQNTVGEFISGMTSLEGLTNVLPPVALANLFTSAPAIWKRVQEAEKTPAWSQERWEAGLGVAGALGFAGPIAKGTIGLARAAAIPKGGELDASKITSPESVPVPPVREGVGGEAPLRQQGETPSARPEQVIPPQEEVVPETARISQAQPEQPVQEGGEIPTASEQFLVDQDGNPVRPPSETPIGARAATLFEREAQGLVTAPEAGEGIGWREAAELGAKEIDAGRADPYEIVSKFRTDGKVSTRDMGVMRAHLERLQQDTNLAGDALLDKPNDPIVQQAFEDAKTNEQVFTDAYAPMKTVASNTLKSLQGEEALPDAAAKSYTGLSRAFQEINGRDFNPEESARAQQITEQANGAEAEYAKTNQEFLGAIDKEYGRIRQRLKVSKKPTLEEIGRIFRGIDEVCP